MRPGEALGAEHKKDTINSQLTWLKVMESNSSAIDRASFIAMSSSLQAELKTVSEKCINCELCQKECEFLRKYGKPKNIADAYDSDVKAHQSMSFECSLCQLCTAVCPVDVNPAEMFLEMRREAVRQGNGDYPGHAGILAYERRGTSKRYSWYGLPEGCDTILFPGCTLTGTRPNKTFKLFEYMKQKIPSLGIVLDCCTKPSHDLGRKIYFHSMFEEMQEFLLKNGIKNVFVACPNCYKMFHQFSNTLAVKTVYEFMSDNGFSNKINLNEIVTIHDPCAVRFEGSIQSAVRNLVTKQGLTIREMPHSREKALCCGEGGAVCSVSPEISKKWGKLREQETNGNRAITYCAGCTSLLNKNTPTSHILDLLFEPESTLKGKAKVSQAPVTYWNRLRLKNRLKSTLDTVVSRERKFSAGENNSKANTSIRIIALLLIIGAIVSVHLTGATQYLEEETLRQWVQSYGVLAPIIYMLIYIVAPALFLPGLPLTIAGGILFGPFWGVVYSITSATIGACVAFLISRYIARDWISSKLKSPKWERLDQGVEHHGWKVVAFTRLIPIFPFNLLNYAFGLTKIKFMHYAVTTFICMLPACIAFIVFSSSLLDVLKGKISPAFIAGLLLIVLVSLIPLFYKRYKAKNSEIRDQFFNLKKR